jgi:RNA:NAD 2'-phosphotransferase (TPT1/KptA family)
LGNSQPWLCAIISRIPCRSTRTDGIIFEKSANGVILTKGKKGVLAPEYFKQVKNKKGEILYP